MQTRPLHAALPHRRLVLALTTLLVCGLIAAGSRTVSADTSNTFSTTTPVAPGGTLMTAVNTAGVTISSSSAVGGCPTPMGIGTAVVTYNCGGSGISVGTTITQTFSGPSGLLTETITYNANGQVTGFPAVTDPTQVNGTCTPASSASDISSCTGQTPAPIGPNGGTLRLNVIGSGDVSPRQTVGFNQIPLSQGTCPRTVPPTNSPPPGGLSETVGALYTCGPGQSIPMGTSVGIVVRTQGLGTPRLSIVANENASQSAPLPGTQGVPLPNSQTLPIGATATPASAGSAGSAGSATTTAGPSLSALSPSSGPAGTQVLLIGSNLTGVTEVDFGAAPVVNVSCSVLSGTSCTATAPAEQPGTTVNVTVTTTAGTTTPQLFTFTGTGGTGSSPFGSTSSNGTTSSVSNLPPSNIGFSSAPSFGTAGQPLTFSADPATSANGCGSIQSYSFNFGDTSGSQSGQSASHTYTSAGTYVVTLTVTDCAGMSGTASTNIAIQPGASNTASSSGASSTSPPSGSTLSSSPSSTGSSTSASSPTASSSASGSSVAYLSGWNIIAGPTGTTPAGVLGSFYTIQSGDSSYETLSNQSLQAGEGYWVYFPVAISSPLPPVGSQTVTVPLPAGQFVLIGNPGTTPATVSGADLVLTFDPGGNGYVATTTLAPGQGAWAISQSGGTAIIAGQ